MGKFVLAEHLPSSVSQYLLPSGSGIDSGEAIKSGTPSSNIRSSRQHHHRRSNSEPISASSCEDSNNSGGQSNATSATVSDEELSSGPEENVEVIHSLRVPGVLGGSDGRLSPSLSTATGFHQQHPEQRHSCRSTRSTFIHDGGKGPNSNNDGSDSEMALQLDRYGFITNLDSKGHLFETHGDESIRVPTFAEAQRTERREKKWNGMLQGLENKSSSSQNKRRVPTAAKTPSAIRTAPPATCTTLPPPNMAIHRSKNQKQLIRRLRKGVPESMRGRIWSILGGGIRVLGLYQEIVQTTSDAMLENFKLQQQQQQQQAEPDQMQNGKGADQPSTVSTAASTDPTSPTSSHSSSSPSGGQLSEGDTEGRRRAKRECRNGQLRIGGDASSTPRTTMASSSPTVTTENFVTTRIFRTIQDTIERDIHRTFPRHNLFYEEERHAVNGDNGGGTGNGELSPNAAAATKNATTVMLASPTEAQTLIASGICDPDVAALILNLETDIKMASSGSTSGPVTANNGASYTTTPGGQAALRRVLRAYSYYDSEVGYCQGMNFIAGMFLTVMSEEEAFWLLVSIMHNEPCKMRDLFGEGMRETHKVLFVAEKLIHHYLPRLARHLDQEHIHVTMFATQWLLTLYTSSFKFDLVFRVWDAFLGEGWKVIYRIMLALLQKYQLQLMKMSFEEILTFFRDLPEQVEGYQIVEMALKIPLRKKVIARYEKEWIAAQQQQENI